MSELKKELDWLYNLERFGSRLELDRIEKIMELFDNPQNKLKFVHIAGTNGKGSTASMVSSSLREAGYETGLYTSPHLLRFNERIQMNGKEITDEEAVYLIEEIRKVMEENGLQLTFFEFVTAIAFLYFSKQNAEYVVVEVGLGGRYDATNIINPVIAAITNIDLDHTHILGNSKLEISKEKAGIVKKGNPLVSGVDEVDEDVNEYLRELCSELGCELIHSDKEIEDYVQNNFTVGLIGKHQIKNASVALLILRKLGIDEKYIHAGFENVKWPGRIDIRSWHGKNVIMDSAHNSAGMLCFVDYVRNNVSGDNTIIIGFSKDKNIVEMIEILKDVISSKDSVYVTKSNFKPADISDVRDIVKEIDNDITIETFENSTDAVEKALENDRDIIITGSIYLIGKILQQEKRFV
ncbi:hypothetical protein CL614_06415 [archaeon]|nr:hypothetical protein [archaeon]|tara:strand:+ start:378 stop:1604 length:1227 start_codon:yes stop_codon:yes gene_type:complete